MYLSILLALGISTFPAFAGNIGLPDKRQTSLLDVVQPIYHLDDDARLKAFSEAQLELKINAEMATSDTLQNLGPSLKHTHYSGYVETQVKDMEEIASLLANADDFDTFIHRASVLRSFVNPTTYNFALKRAVLIRKDTTDLWYPSLPQINSRSFFTEEAISHAIKRTRKDPNTNTVKFSTGTLADPEYRTAWFREDIGLNEMHARISAAHFVGNADQIDIFHLFTQMLARYDAERFAVELPRVAEIRWRHRAGKEAIAEGYDPHLSTSLGEKRFAARPAYMDIRDDLRDPDNPRTDEQFLFLAQKIVDNIRTGFMTNGNGDREPMTKDLLDDMITGTSKNKRLYTEQGMHKLGHQILSAITDPDGRYQQEIGVLGAQETAMRDPVFYRYHRLMYNFYDMYQMLLPAYSQPDLVFSGIRVDELKVESTANPQEGILETFMENAEEHILYDPTIEDHLPKDSRTPLKIPYERLNHDDFEYLIKVHNNNPKGDDIKAAVRIFIAPHNDETKMAFKSLNDQRRFFIEMDKFVTTLKRGDNVIKRSSDTSSVSFPSVDTYEQWKAFVDTHGLRSDRLTGCGWPSNLLLPRGTAEGMDFDLFVMLTDWEKDRAETVGPNKVPNLDFGSSLCGVKGEAYPDNKSRGFPFDRKFDRYTSLADFAEDSENVFVGSLKIIHKK